MAVPKWLRVLLALEKFTATERSQVYSTIWDNAQQEEVAEDLANTYDEGEMNENQLVEYFRLVIAMASERRSEEMREMRLREMRLKRVRVERETEELRLKRVRVERETKKLRLVCVREERKLKKLHSEELRLENQRELTCSDWINSLLQLSYGPVGDRCVFSEPHFSPADPDVLHRIQKLFDKTPANWYEGIQVQHLRGNRTVNIGDIVPKPGNQVINVDESSDDTRVEGYAAFGYTVALVAKCAAEALQMQVESIRIIIEKPMTTGRKQFLDCQTVLRLKNGSIVTFYSEGKSQSAVDTGCNVRKDEFAEARGEAIQCFLREFQSAGANFFGFPIVFDGPHVEVLDVNVRSESIHRSGLSSIVKKSSNYVVFFFSYALVLLDFLFLNSPRKRGRHSLQSEPSKEEHSEEHNSDMHLVVDSTSTAFQVLASSVVKRLEEANEREIGKRIQNREELQLQLEGSTKREIVKVEQVKMISGVHQVSLDGQKYWLKLGEQVDQEVESRKALCEEDSIRGVPVNFPDFPTVKGILLEDAGPSLDKLVVDPEQVHEMGRQLYVKLQHINEVHKIYHNDISPRNICLKDGIYRLIDWGFASWEDLEATSDLKALAECCMKLLRGNDKFVYAPLRQFADLYPQDK